MIHPFFRLSDKAREYSTRVIIFSMLVVFFEYYPIKLAKLTFFDVEPILKSTNPSIPDLKVGVVFVIVAIYYYLLLVGTYISEAVDLYRPELESIQVDIIDNKFGSPTLSSVGSTVSQQVKSAKVQQKEKFLFELSRFTAYIRFFTELLLPTAAISLACYVEIDSAIDMISAML